MLRLTYFQDTVTLCCVTHNSCGRSDIISPNKMRSFMATTCCRLHGKQLLWISALAATHHFAACDVLLVFFVCFFTAYIHIKLACRCTEIVASLPSLSRAKAAKKKRANGYGEAIMNFSQNFFLIQYDKITKESLENSMCELE